MKVYNLLIDFDCTTRSPMSSVGLFLTKELAEKALKRECLKSWQRSCIVEQTVYSG
jgi:hypothetical protein